MFKLMFGFIAGILFALVTIILSCVGITMAEDTAKKADQPAADPFNLK